MIHSSSHIKRVYPRDIGVLRQPGYKRKQQYPHLINNSKETELEQKPDVRPGAPEGSTTQVPLMTAVVINNINILS